MGYLPLTNGQYDELVDTAWSIIGEVQDNFPCTNDDDGEAVDPHLHRIQQYAGYMLDILGSVEGQDVAVTNVQESVMPEPREEEGTE